VKLWAIDLLALGAVVLVVSGIALSVTSGIVFPPASHKHTDQELAKGCHATVDDLKKARATAASSLERAPSRLGRCSLSKDAEGHLVLNVLEPGQATQ
jgi:hypothetical protein